MKFANIRELKLETNRVLKMTEKNGPVVILRKGKPVAVVSSVSEKDFSLRVNEPALKIRKNAGRAGVMFGGGNTTEDARVIK